MEEIIIVAIIFFSIFSIPVVAMLTKYKLRLKEIETQASSEDQYILVRTLEKLQADNKQLVQQQQVLESRITELERKMLPAPSAPHPQELSINHLPRHTI